MSAFRQALGKHRNVERGRKWIFVASDQLSDQLGPLSREKAGKLGIVLVETPAKAARRPYHRQKLALVLANLRHFALEQAARGVAVRHVVSSGGYLAALQPLVPVLGPLRMMRPAERELRSELQPLIDSGGLVVIPHEGWLTTETDFNESQHGGKPPFRMDAFYRQVRRGTGLLMENGKPIGGRFSFDPENRESWRGEPKAPESPRFPRDVIKDEVCDLIEQHYAHHPGTLDRDELPATLADAESLWARGRALLPWFGPYEDAMAQSSTSLFHSRVSGLLNLCRLLPERLVREAAAADAPLASREGFIRQILGWREFVRHVHDQTDGFRRLLSGAVPELDSPGDGGYARWAGKPWPRGAGSPGDGGALPNALQANTPLPAAYWGKPSGLHCLDTVVQGVWREAYSHHITRLMVLSNIAMLLGCSPRELADWFWVAYLDAYDWVVEPNVLAMGSFAPGDVMTTKPYVAGAAYVNRMSDYCGDCAFDPRSNCPLTPMYWDFLARNEPRLAGNQRLKLPLATLRKRTSLQKAQAASVRKVALAKLGKGERLEPADFASPLVPTPTAPPQSSPPAKGPPSRSRPRR